MQDLVAAVSGAQGYAVTTGGSGSLVLTRRYTPTWAVVLAIIGLLVFFIGLLFLLVKNTETLTVTLRSSGGGTEVRITGLATTEVQARINAVLSARPVSQPQPESASQLAPSVSDDVEDRLERLERLHSDGVIGSDEYKQQRERLLTEI